MASTPTNSPPPPNSKAQTPPPPDLTTLIPPPDSTTNTAPPPMLTLTPPAPDTSTPPPAAANSPPPPKTATSSAPPPATSPPVTKAPPPNVPTPPPITNIPPPNQGNSSPPPAAPVMSPPPPKDSTPPATNSTAPSPPKATAPTQPPPAVPKSPPPEKNNTAAPPTSSGTTTPSPPVSSTTPTLAPPGTSASTPPPPELPVSSTSPSPPSSGGISSGAATGIALGVAVVLLGLVGIICYRRKRRPINEGYQPQVYQQGFGMPSGQYSTNQMSETPFLLASPHRGMAVNYSGGYNYNSGSNNNSGPNYNNNNSGPNYNSGNNYNSSNYNSSGNFSSATKRTGSKMHDMSIVSSQACFSYEELYEITGGFAPEKILGEGGFGCVYKGTLSDGKDVAVKQLKGGGGQGEREFQAEVEIISRVHHRHLVSLVGYCISEDHRLLVYDFVSNGTLHYHLFAKGKPCMEWSTRVKVAAGSARGLAYLHEDCHPRIIHRDIKSSNILIDDNFEAQVADFGLARPAENDVTHVSTRVMGTFGYLAPEYASTGKLTERSDVFSFGVVLLELITGRKPVDGNQPLGEESLVEWARPHLTEALESGDFKELVDPRLGTNYIETEMFRMVETAAACIRHSASRRPKMSQVVRALDSLTDEVDISNGVQPGKSQMFNVANTADIKLFQKMAFGSQDFSSDSYHSRTNSNLSTRNF